MLKSNLPIILVSTALVILAGAIFLPFWFHFDPVLKILQRVRSLATSGLTDGTGSGLTSGAGQWKVFTKDELAKYGADKGGDKVYLAMLGRVFDVSKGKKHYGKGGGYSFFSGRDGTRAFITGEFDDKGLTDDIKGLRSEDCFALADWVRFYEKEYTYVGKVIGNFYNEKGEETEEVARFWKEVDKAEENQSKEKAEQRVFPDCNSRWSQNEGASVWCTTERYISVSVPASQ